MTDDERFVNAITALAESYRQKASPGLFHGYRMGLSGVAIADIERAAALALQRCKFMPVPAELRELAMGSGQSYEAMAEQAFSQLRSTIQQTGADYSVNFADGAINAAVRALGGWQRVCNMPIEEFDKWFRKDFAACYVNICRNGASPEAMRYLGGNLERDNARWDGQVNPRIGEVYRIDFFGAGIRDVGSDYPPALPSPPPPNRRRLGARDYLTIEDNGRLSPAGSPVPTLTRCAAQPHESTSQSLKPELTNASRN